MKTRLFVCALAAGACVAPAITLAAGGETIEEIVVTAHKRSQLLQDLPAAVTALTEGALQKMGADDFLGYAMTVPGLSFVDKGPGARKVVLRGISTGTDGERSPTVGVYIDDLPITAGGPFPDLKLFDVERVEILRGPQGTLYGAGSMGGTLKIVTNKPSTERLEGMVEADVSSTRDGGESYSLSGMLNVPVIDDKLALRTVLYQRDRAGYVDNVALGAKDVNDEEVQGGRFMARFQPTEALTLTATVLREDVSSGGRPTVDILPDGEPAYDDLQQARQFAETLEDDLVVGNLTLEYDFGWAALTSASSYFDRSRQTATDVSTFFGGLGLAVSQIDFADAEAWVEELRLTSQSQDPLQWLFGAFFYDRTQVSGQSFPSDAAAGSPFVNLGLSSTQTEERQRALFGEISYDLTDALQLTAGARWFDVRQRFDGWNKGLLFGAPIDTSDPPTRQGRASESVVNLKFQVAYQLTPDVLLFAQAAEGFRQGGPLAALPNDAVTGAPAPTQFNADSLWNYELGLKSSWFANTVLLNLSAFYIDWSDIQTLVRRQDGLSYTGNGGKASSRGLELEASVRPAPGLSMSLSSTYTRAQLEQDAPLIGGVKGDQVPGVPEFSASASAEYAFSLTSAVEAFVYGDFSYVGSTRNAFELSLSRPSFDQESYDLANLRTGVRWDGWELTLYASNLFDARPSLYVETLLPDVIQKTTLRPRTVGLLLRSRF
ncbi:MAG TPA: TonB-dependent receptor [Steroidobacter sp.]|uniref:TonB-dependent receptor n=1 Tax=Steroidobacter sp. TaxID=1978227 RepID=UPI002ED8E4DD